MSSLNGWRIAWPSLLALLAPTAHAAAEPKLMQAAVLVTTFDRLDAGCAGGYTAAQREQVQRWQADNSVDAVRARLPELRADAAVASGVDRSVAQIIQVARSKGASDCVAAASLTKLPDAQIGGLAAASPAAKPPPVEPASPVPSATLDLIDSFTFATRSKMGLGGFIALDIYPVVLFKSGELLTDVRGLRFVGGLASHKAAHPDAWSRWRREGGKLQMLKAGQWANVPFNKTYARLPADLRLSGKFRSVGGTGNVAVGGSQTVTVVDEYRFSADGSVLRSGAVGGTAQAGATSVVTSGGPGERRGRYRIDGLLLRIDYEDGSREQRVLITDPEKPNGTLWLDGESYVERR